MTETASQIREISVDKDRNVAVDFSGYLDAGETLSGTPTLTEQTTSNLTLTNAQVSTAELIINQTTVDAGKAVQFTVNADTTGTFSVLVEVGTTGSQELDGIVKIRAK